jgi:hypothetical protein
MQWRRALLEKPQVMQLLKNFPTFYGIRRFVTMFTRALDWSLSWAKSIQPIPPHHISLRYILMLSTHLRLDLSSGLLPYRFPANILYAIHFYPIRATWPANFTLLDLGLLSKEFVQVRDPSWCFDTSLFFTVRSSRQSPTSKLED